MDVPDRWNLGRMPGDLADMKPAKKPATAQKVGSSGGHKAKVAASLASAPKESALNEKQAFVEGEYEVVIPVRREKKASPGGFGPRFHDLMTPEEAKASIPRHQWPFYVYALCTHTGAAFYIGKGTGNRLFEHKADADAGGTSAKCQMIRAAGDRLRYALYAVCKDEAYAYGIEACLINAHYDDLTNVQPGTLAAMLKIDDEPQDETERILMQTLRTVKEAEDGVNRCAQRVAARCPVARRLLAAEGFDV